MYNVYAKEKEKRKKKRKKRRLLTWTVFCIKLGSRGRKPDRKGVGGDDNDDVVVCSKRKVFLEQREGPL